jgi:hypothetical protein
MKNQLSIKCIGLEVTISRKQMKVGFSFSCNQMKVGYTHKIINEMEILNFKRGLEMKFED